MESCLFPNHIRKSHSRLITNQTFMNKRPTTLNPAPPPVILQRAFCILKSNILFYSKGLPIMTYLAQITILKSMMVASRKCLNLIKLPFLNHTFRFISNIQLSGTVFPILDIKVSNGLKLAILKLKFFRAYPLVPHILFHSNGLAI